MPENQGAKPVAAQSSICPDCGASLVPLDAIHVERKCEQCGKTKYVVEPGDGGQGINVQEGDRFIIPPGAITLSLDPLKTTGRFSRPGISWFVQLLLFEGMPGSLSGCTAEALTAVVGTVSQQADRILADSTVVSGLDLETEDGAKEALARLKDRQDLPEFWAMITGSMASAVEKYLRQGESLRAVWAMAVLMNARAMGIFRGHLEEAVWRGYRLGRLRDALDAWRQNGANADEEFWQKTLAEFSFVLSQVFSYPVTIFRSKAYVGGKSINNTGGSILDFLLTNQLTMNSVLVEIKTPQTRLTGTLYRDGVYSISGDLTGAIVQVSNYKDSLLKDYYAVTSGSEVRLNAFDPACLVIAGSTGEFQDPVRAKSFELFRQGLRGVQVITYDELFGKVRTLAELLEDATTPVL